MVGIKALHDQATTLSSQFRKGHRKITKGIIDVNPTPALLDWLSSEGNEKSDGKES